MSSISFNNAVRHGQANNLRDTKDLGLSRRVNVRAEASLPSESIKLTGAKSNRTPGQLAPTVVPQHRNHSALAVAWRFCLHWLTKLAVLGETIGVAVLKALTLGRYTSRIGSTPPATRQTSPAAEPNSADTSPHKTTGTKVVDDTVIPTPSANSAIVYPEAKLVKKVDPECLPRELWNQVLSYSFSIDDLCALRRHPYFEKFVAQECKNLDLATAIGALASFITRNQADEEHSQGDQNSHELAYLAHCTSLSIESDKLQRQVKNSKDYVEKLGICFDAMSSLEWLEMIGAGSAAGDNEPHQVRALVIGHIKKLPRLKSLCFLASCFEMQQLQQLSDALKTGTNLQELFLATRGPSRGRDSEETDDIFGELADALKNHTRLKNLHIKLLGGLNKSMIDSFDDMLQALPEVKNFFLKKIHYDDMFHDEAARLSFIQMMRNFSRAEVLDLSSFNLCTIGMSWQNEDLDSGAETSTMFDLAEPLKAMTSLRELDLGNNARQEGAYDATIDALRFCTSLEKLSLLGAVTNLERLDHLLLTLRSLPKFRTLTISTIFSQEMKLKLQVWTEEDPDKRLVIYRN